MTTVTLPRINQEYFTFEQLVCEAGHINQAEIDKAFDALQACEIISANSSDYTCLFVDGEFIAVQKIEDSFQWSDIMKKAAMVVFVLLIGTSCSTFNSMEYVEKSNKMFVSESTTLLGIFNFADLHSCDVDKKGELKNCKEVSNVIRPVFVDKCRGRCNDNYSDRDLRD